MVFGVGLKVSYSFHAESSGLGLGWSPSVSLRHF